MMLQDQLTKAERLRLESLSQAMNMSVITTPLKPTIQIVLENAKTIEAFLKAANGI